MFLGEAWSTPKGGAYMPLLSNGIVVLAGDVPARGVSIFRSAILSSDQGYPRGSLPAISSTAAKTHQHSHFGIPSPLLGDSGLQPTEQPKDHRTLHRQYVHKRRGRTDFPRQPRRLEVPVPCGGGLGRLRGGTVDAVISSGSSALD